MPIKVHNVRFGLATNSSSTHSLIFMPEGEVANDDCDKTSFGWDFFTASEKESKQAYVGILLMQVLCQSLPTNIAKLVCKKWNKYVPDIDDSIDHESTYQFPNAFGQDIPDQEFFKEFRDFILSENLVILGGNDNTSELHPLSEHGEFFLPYHGYGSLTCRKDPSGYWTIFDKENGTKTRFSLAPTNAFKIIKNPEKAFVPELIDVKISDFCPIGCKFCYQGSTVAGQHAEFSDIRKLADALGELKVFEVAIGGGEPTMHPDFIQILKSFRDAGVVPNFTTKSLHWLKDNKMWPAIIDTCGAFAYSVDKVSEAMEVLSFLKVNGIDSCKVNLQIVNRVVSKPELLKIMKLADDEDLRVTLLGYKDTGRGAQYREDPYSYLEKSGAWLNAVKELQLEYSCPAFGIDTMIASEFKKDLDKSGVCGITYETEEGKFSCYIDLVEGKIGPSSYCSKEEMLDFKIGKSWGSTIEDEVTSKFAQF